MIPSSFHYHTPGSVEEAITLLDQHGDDAKLLGGGHSLIPAMKLRLSNPERIIDISKIESLRFIKEADGHLVIGGGTTHDEIANSALVRDKITMFAEAAGMIGDQMVRNRGTLGGSIAHADPAADWPALLLASDASVVIQGSGGERSVAAADFFTGIFMTALTEKEIITAVRIPIPAANTRSTYMKFTQPASRFAIVGCAAMVTTNDGRCENVRVAFAGVASSPFRDTAVEDALNGKDASADHIGAAANAAAEGDISVMKDHFAGEDYRKNIAKVYAKRALSAITS